MNIKVIIIGILLVSNLATLFYAFIQKSTVDEQRALADAARQEALMQQEIAQQQQALAEANAEEAMRQTVIARQQVEEAEARLADCK